MAGVNNALAEKHVPYVKPRKDWLAGPEGRKADRVCICRPLQERLLNPPSACACSPMYIAALFMNAPGKTAPDSKSLLVLRLSTQMCQLLQRRASSTQNKVSNPMSAYD